MATFDEAAAGRALSVLARQRATDSTIATPSDVCLMAWLAAEAARRNSNPFHITVRQMFVGIQDDHGRTDKVGLALNTITSGLDRLVDGGFISILGIKRVAGGGKLMAIEING